MSTQSSQTIADHLRDDGFETLAEYHVAGTRLTGVTLGDFRSALEDGWVLRLSNDSGEKQYGVSTTGELMQINDKDRNGEFGRPYPCYEGEFGDYVFSGHYAVEIIYPADSAFDVADD